MASTPRPVSSIQSPFTLPDGLSPSSATHEIGPIGLLLLVGISLAALLPGTMGISYFDRDEGWYAQVSREMRESGDYLIPTYLGEPWIGKPPLLYWLANTSQRYLGVGEWQARLVSVVSTTVACLFTAFLGARMFGRGIGILAGALFVTSGMTAIVGKMLLADPLMIALTSMAIFWHWRMAHRGATHPMAILYWLFIGLGILAKGPATLLFAGGFAIALATVPHYRGWLTSGRFWGWIPLSLLVAVPWYIYAYLFARDTLVDQFLWYEVLGRFWSDLHGRHSPPGLCLAVSLFGLLPWTPLVVAAVVNGVRHARTDAPTRVLLIWTILPWVVIEFMQAKLPHYVLPCYVPLAILTARYLMIVAGAANGHWKGLNRPERNVFTAAVGVMVILGILLSGLGAAMFRTLPGKAVLLLGICTAIGFLLAGWTLRTRTLRVGLTTTLVTGVLFHIVFGMGVLSAMEPSRLARQLARTLNLAAAPGQTIVLSGFREPSLYYYLDQPATYIHPGELPSFLSKETDPLIVSASQEALMTIEDRAFRQRLSSALSDQTLAAINHGNMDYTTVHVGEIDPKTLFDAETPPSQ